MFIVLNYDKDENTLSIMLKHPKREKKKNDKDLNLVNCNKNDHDENDNYRVIITTNNDLIKADSIIKAKNNNCNKLVLQDGYDYVLACY